MTSLKQFQTGMVPNISNSSGYKNSHSSTRHFPRSAQSTCFYVDEQTLSRAPPNRHMHAPLGRLWLWSVLPTPRRVEKQSNSFSYLLEIVGLVMIYRYSTTSMDVSDNPAFFPLFQRRSLQ
jgi:hypothetical protein